MSTRRRTILAAGAAGAAGLVTGCGGNGGDGGSAPSEQPTSDAPGATPTEEPTGEATGAQSPSSAAPPDGEELAKTADIPVGGGKIFPDPKVVVTQPEAGEFKAFSAVCTHQGCTVSKVAEGTIDCACHGSKYRIADASVAAGPATKPLPPKQITVAGDTILLT